MIENYFAIRGLFPSVARRLTLKVILGHLESEAVDLSNNADFPLDYQEGILLFTLVYFRYISVLFFFI
jgi:hypothetical protein